MPYAPAKNNSNLSQSDISSSFVSLLCVITIGFSLFSGAWFAFSVLVLGSKNGILAKVIVIGLLYLVGLVLSLLGIRVLRNYWLPYCIQGYAWIVLGGIVILQILIISRLYQQEYHFSSYVKYLFLFGAGLIALVGLHLTLERHSLMPFGIVILLTGLGHLYSMGYHYVFAAEVNYVKVWGDLGFFFVTTIAGILVLARFGMLTDAQTS